MALLITAAIYAGFAIWLGSTPAALLTTFGIESSTPAMLTEIRAFYGGIEMGIAVAMLVLWSATSSLPGYWLADCRWPAQPSDVAVV
ncbi:MAG: hypothetical protein R3C56_29685 [Pirellulaceae bacterium]